MTGMSCSNARKCKIYNDFYGDNFNNSVINPYGDQLTCEAITEVLSGRDAEKIKVLKKNLKSLATDIPSCPVLGSVEELVSSK